MNKKLVLATIVSFGAFSMFAYADDVAGTPVDNAVPAHSEVVEKEKVSGDAEMQSGEVKAAQNQNDGKYKKAKKAKKAKKSEEAK